MKRGGGRQSCQLQTVLGKSTSVKRNIIRHRIREKLVSVETPRMYTMLYVAATASFTKLKYFAALHGMTCSDFDPLRSLHLCITIPSAFVVSVRFQHMWFT